MWKAHTFLRSLVICVFVKKFNDNGIAILTDSLCTVFSLQKHPPQRLRPLLQANLGRALANIDAKFRLKRTLGLVEKMCFSRKVSRLARRRRPSKTGGPPRRPASSPERASGRCWTSPPTQRSGNAFRRRLSHIK